MVAFPTNLRALNICRTPDGMYQASLQTDEHAANAFSVAVAETVEEVVRFVCGIRWVAPSAPPPPY
jgi:hypothetical protein